MTIAARIRAASLLTVVGLHAGVFAFSAPAPTREQRPTERVVEANLVEAPRQREAAPAHRAEAPPALLPAAPARPRSAPARPVRHGPAPAPRPAEAIPPTPAMAAAPAPSPAPIAAAAPDGEAAASPPEAAPVASVGPAPTHAPVEAPVTPPGFDADYLHNPAPAYPPLARRLGEQGRVLVRVFVEADGSPSRLELRASSGSARLDGAALETVRHWRFVPARRGDVPVAAWVVVPVSFNLKES